MNIYYTFISLLGVTTDPTGGGGPAPSGGTTKPSPAVSTTTSDCPHKITNVLSCQSTGDGSIWNILAAIINFLAIGVGVAVVLGIVFGGFLYASAGGSAEQTKRGIGYIRNALIALLLFIFMYAIINFIIPGGLL